MRQAWPWANYDYDIHGLVTISSEYELPELSYFEVTRVEHPDVFVASRATKAKMIQRNGGLPRSSEQFRYEEALHPLSLKFEIVVDDSGIFVFISTLLTKSRHVLYSNIVEPLLRFLMASKGHMLLHSAAVLLDGQGVMLSARTDTGKTSTVLKLLQEHGGEFMSDDMTIITEDGLALRYPKPLTISAHTLHSVPKHRLKRRQRVALHMQSRLHSRTGRSVGQWLDRAFVPVMSLNAMVQIAMPPPKYQVRELVPCRLRQRMSVDHIFVIERSPTSQASAMSLDEAVETLMANTDDAYSFPPFASMAPHLVIKGMTIEDVKRHERQVLRSALRDVDVVRLESPSFGWKDMILEQLGSEEEVAVEVAGAPPGALAKLASR